MELTTACAVLARTPGLTAGRVHEWVTEAGSIELAIARHIRSFDEAQIAADLHWIEASGAQVIHCTSPTYPPMLARTPSAPAVLYVLGDIEVLCMPQLAMVG